MCGGRRGARRKTAGLVVKIFCLHRDVERGDSCAVLCEFQDLPIQTSEFFFQKLRAQEAAQAEADDREELEIAAEMAGIPHQTIVFLSSVQILQCPFLQSCDFIHPGPSIPYVCT